jgi:hypothetical protein
LMILAVKQRRWETMALMPISKDGRSGVQLD